MSTITRTSAATVESVSVTTDNQHTIDSVVAGWFADVTGDHETADRMVRLWRRGVITLHQVVQNAIFDAPYLPSDFSWLAHDTGAVTLHWHNLHGKYWQAYVSPDGDTAVVTNYP